MTAKVDSPEWKAKLNDVIFDFYLEHGAPKRFYRGDCVPYKLLDYMAPDLCQNHGEILLFVNTSDDGMLSPYSSDFIIFTTLGIVAYNVASKIFRDWAEITENFRIQKAKAAIEFLPGLANQVAKQISDVLVTTIAGEEDRELLASFVRRVVRVMVGVDELPPARLPYFPLPSSADDTSATGKAAPASSEPTPMPKTATNAKLQVDF